MDSTQAWHALFYVLFSAERHKMKGGHVLTDKGVRG
jgi:hypothetical protein